MKAYDMVIKNGIIVTATDVYKADIGVKNEKIVEIAKEIDSNNAANVIDATDKYVFPGAIDVHTHLDMPFGGTVSSDNFETGTVAAAYGGTTTIIDFAIQSKGESLKKALEIWHNKAQGKAFIDYGFHIAITDMNDEILDEMKELIKEGYPSFKLFMTYEGLRVNDDVLLKALLLAKEEGGLICVHAENFYIIDYLVKKFVREGKTHPKFHALSRPTIAEWEAVSRAIKVAQFANAPLYIVHLSCMEALKEVTYARNRGLPIMAETCPQYLLLSEERYEEEGFNGAKYVMSPPLRSSEHLQALWEGLKCGQLQVVSTDHCPFFLKGQKDLGKDSFDKIPNGAPGIELRLALLFSYGVMTKRITLQQFVEIISTNPAKIFGLYPQKGTVTIGSDADLVIFDPSIEKRVTKELLHENDDYTPYEGFKITGLPVTTIVRGKVVIKDGKLVGQKGYGKFLKRKNLMVV